MRQNLNLRGKNPSKDRWAVSTGSNLDPYLYEDDLFKVNWKKNSNQRIETGAKTRPVASFLLCAGRKSMRSSSSSPVERDGVRPLQRPSNMDEMSGQRPDYRREFQSRRRLKTSRYKYSGKPMTNASHLPVVQLEKSSLPATMTSEHGCCFDSVAGLRRRRTFWAGGATREFRGRPVPTPRLTAQFPNAVHNQPTTEIFARDSGTSSADNVRESCEELSADVTADHSSSLRVISETIEERPGCPRSQISIQQFLSGLFHFLHVNEVLL